MYDDDGDGDDDADIDNYRRRQLPLSIATVHGLWVLFWVPHCALTITVE